MRKCLLVVIMCLDRCVSVAAKLPSVKCNSSSNSKNNNSGKGHSSDKRTSAKSTLARCSGNFKQSATDQRINLTASVSKRALRLGCIYTAVGIAAPPTASCCIA